MLKLNTRKTSIFIAVVGLLIFLHAVKILAPVELFATNTLRPILSDFYSLGSYLRITYDEQVSKRDLAVQVKLLESQVNQLTVENANFKMLREENQLLREHLKFLSKDESKYVMGNIISRGALSNAMAQNQIIIIDKGAKDGLSPGLGVVSSQGIIVGKIISVKDHLSEVYLTTSPVCGLAATIQNHDKTTGIVRGELGLTIKMEFIPQTEEIKVGDITITSGLEQNIPRGLVIGKVTQVARESNELWQKAIIEPLVDMEKLVIVSVLLP